MIRAWFWNMLIAIDQLANTATGGDPDETISSRVAKRAHRRGWKILARIIEAIDPGHLARTREDDEGGNASF